jgi:glucan biosynthesis protein C
LVAGYFTPGALAKKGPVQFIAGRFWRLGLPSIVYLLFVSPFVIWIQVPIPWAGNAASFSDFYFPYLLSAGYELLGLGPMWFAVALLLFSIIYAMVGSFLPHRQNASMQAVNVSTGRLALLILIITAGAFVFRQYYQPGELLWGMQPAFFSQYIVFFIAGIYAAETNCFETISAKIGYRWLIYGLILGFAGLLTLRIVDGQYNFSTLTVNTLNASSHSASYKLWRGLFFDLWESFFAVAMSVGFLTFFRDKFNYSNAFTAGLSASAFAVYMFHPPIIIAVSLAMRSIELAPPLKWLMASFISVPLCFLIAYYVLIRIPVLKKII